MVSGHSVFIYGFVVGATNYFLDFKEGAGPELTAEIQVGSYSAQSFCTALKTALDAEGALTYTVTFNRETLRITIAATGAFTLLTHSGSHVGSSPIALMGFSSLADTSSATTHTGTLQAGDAFKPQFPLQDHIASDDWQEAVDASINNTASGDVEVVKFGTKKFMQANIMLANNYPSADTGMLRYNPTGYEDLRRFIQYLVTKAPVEFIADENDTSIYETMILESTPESTNGTGYKLKEMYDRGARGYWQTGTLKFRVVGVN